MKTYLKVLSFILAVVMTFAAFAACDSSSAESKETSASEKAEESITESAESKPEASEAVSETVTETETEAVSEAEPPRPAANYDTDFYLLIQQDSNRFDYHWVAESSNDVLSQAIFDRQQKVFNHLGVNVIGSKTLVSKEYVEPFKNAVKNKDGSIDVMLSHVFHGIDGFITGNYLSKLDEVPGIDLEADYWNMDIIEEASFNGDYYLAKNDFNILYTHCLTFNKDLMEKYKDAIEEDVYSMVDNYRWTLDNMISLTSLVYIDETSDGKTKDDTFGIAGPCNTEVICFMTASDISIIDRNDAGVFELSVYNEVNKAKTTALVDKIKNLVDSTSAWIWVHGSDNITNLQEGKTLIRMTATNNLPALLNYEINFGVLPYPMWDEAQKEIGYRSLQWGGYTCVPSYVEDITMVGDTLEMLVFYSDNVNEAFYEKLIGKQVAESPVDKRMLEIVWNGISIDLAQTYFSAVYNTQILYMLPNLTKPNRSQNLASYIASAERTVNKALRRLAMVD